MDRINITEIMIPCLECTSDLTALHLDNIWTGTRSPPSPFLISTALFFVSIRPFPNGSVFVCSTACSSAAE